MYNAFIIKYIKTSVESIKTVYSIWYILDRFINIKISEKLILSSSLRVSLLQLFPIILSLGLVKVMKQSKYEQILNQSTS